MKSERALLNLEMSKKSKENTILTLFSSIWDNSEFHYPMSAIQETQRSGFDSLTQHAPNIMRVLCERSFQVTVLSLHLCRKPTASQLLDAA